MGIWVALPSFAEYPIRLCGGEDVTLEGQMSGFLIQAGMKFEGQTLVR